MICKGTKSITGCGEDKPETKFHKTKRWRSNVCADCRNKNKRKRYAGEKTIKDISSMAW